MSKRMFSVIVSSDIGKPTLFASAVRPHTHRAAALKELHKVACEAGVRDKIGEVLIAYVRQIRQP